MTEEKIKYQLKVHFQGEIVATFVLRDKKALEVVKFIWRRYVYPDEGLFMQIDTMVDYGEEETESVYEYLEKLAVKSV